MIPKSAPLLNPADDLPVPRGTPRVSPPLGAQLLCWHQTFLGEYPAITPRYCFSYLPAYYRGGVAKSYGALKHLFATLPKPRLPLPLPTKNNDKNSGNWRDSDKHTTGPTEAVWGASPIPAGLPVGAPRIRNFPGLIPSLMTSQSLWDFSKIPQKSSFFVILGWRRRSLPARRRPRSKFYFTISEDFNQFYY